jgi:hypothetical protein
MLDAPQPVDNQAKVVQLASLLLVDFRPGE